MHYASEIYTTPSSLYIKRILYAWLRRHAWIFALLLGGCGILAVTVDIAFILVGLMIAFIIIPGVLAFVYFNYGMKPEAVRWGRPHRLRIDDDTLIIENMVDEVQEKTLPAETIPLSALRSFRPMNGITAIFHGNALDAFVLIPDEAFGESVSSSREAFHRFLYDTIQRNCVTLLT